KKKQTQTAKIDKQQKMHQARFLRRSCVALFQCCNFNADLGRVLVVEGAPATRPACLTASARSCGEKDR
ncbi:hypothetical protein evm_003627, partial [Chilo suppressalis]